MQQHHRIRPVYCALAAVLITLVVASGCAVPGYNEREAMLLKISFIPSLKSLLSLPRATTLVVEAVSAFE